MTITYATTVPSLIADALIDGGFLDNANLRLILFKADFTPSENMTYATMPAKADFTGYADVTPTFGAIFRANDGSYATTSGIATFQATGSTTGNVIYGWALVDATALVLYGTEKIDPPEPVAAALDSVIIAPVVKVPLSALGGSGVNVGV